MKLIAIDRRSANHGEYTATVELKYDEIVSLDNLVYKAWCDTTDDPKLNVLYDSMNGLLQIACHGITMPVNYRREDACLQSEN